MRRFLILALLSTAALIAFAAIPAARPHSLLAGLSGSAQATDKNSADGAAKGQATEGTAVPTKGGKPSKSKKLPGKMKSGT
jgi:hypothetical protein